MSSRPVEEPSAHRVTLEDNMTTTTATAPYAAHRRIFGVRLLLAVFVTAVLLVAVFVAGRTSAPTHTVRSIVTVPATADVSTLCHRGKPC
jgi:hypothetical protein